MWKVSWSHDQYHYTNSKHIPDCTAPTPKNDICVPSGNTKERDREEMEKPRRMSVFIIRKKLEEEEEMWLRW